MDVLDTRQILGDERLSVSRGMFDTANGREKGDQMRFRLDGAGLLAIHIGGLISIHIGSTPGTGSIRANGRQPVPQRAGSTTTVRLGGLVLELGPR